MKKIVFNEKQIEEIVDLYVNKKLSLTKIGQQFGVSRTVITRIIKENNVPIKKDNHTYQANYRIFKDIDTPEKAYWLGFIAADGCVYKREANASIIINIHRKDREHLEKFKKFMDSNVKIIDHIQNQGFSNNTPMSKIVFNSKEMAEDLIAIGITPKKSLTLQPPQIKQEFWKPFILGYFDGDGSISYLKNKEFTISWLGTKEILNWINENLQINNSLEKRKQDNTNNYYIRCGGIHKPYKIMKALYDSCEVHLDRKYEIFTILETVVLSRNAK